MSEKEKQDTQEENFSEMIVPLWSFPQSLVLVCVDSAPDSSKNRFQY
jgi:hypothetical protein